MTLGRQIGWTLGTTAVSTVIVYLITSIMPKTYGSEQSLLFPASQSSLPSFASSILGSSSSSGGDSSSYAAFGPGGISSPVVSSSTGSASAILESRVCRDYVVEKLDLASHWKMSASKASEELRRRAKVKVDDNGLLVITTESGTPEEARDIALKMQEYLDSNSVRLTLNIGKRNRKILEDRLAASEANVQKSIAKFVATATNHPYVEMGPVQELLSDGLKKQGDNRVSIAAAEARISSVETLVKRAMAQGTDAATLEATSAGQIDKGMEALMTEIQKRQLDLQDAKKTYTEKSPEFKVAAMRVKAGDSAIKASFANTLKGLNSKTFAPLIMARSELESFKKAEATYEKILATYKKMALKTPNDASVVKMAQVQFDTNLKISESLRAQLEQAIIAEARDPARYEVIDNAVANPDPIAPRKGLITGAWAGCCLALGTWIIIRKRLKFVD